MARMSKGSVVLGDLEAPLLEAADSTSQTLCVALGYPDSASKLRLSGNAPDAVRAAILIGLAARGLKARASAFALEDDHGPLQRVWTLALRDSPFDSTELINSSALVLDVMRDCGHKLITSASPAGRGGSQLLMYFRPRGKRSTRVPSTSSSSSS